MTIRELITEAHETAKEKGWWDGKERSVGDQFANFHAELSEAWEDYRKYGMKYYQLFTNTDDGDKPAGPVVSEL